MLTDWMVREYLPAWLRAVGLNGQAEVVAALFEITSAESWSKSREVADVAKKKSAAAWAAAGAAAGAAAQKALRPTVEGIQRSALRLIDRMIDVGIK
jgi:hypothetical protein